MQFVRELESSDHAEFARLAARLSPGFRFEDLLGQRDLAAPTAAGYLCWVSESVADDSSQSENSISLAAMCIARKTLGIVELLFIGVRDDCRRRGHAAALMDTLLRWSRASGADQIELEVRESNRAAIELYLSFGYRQVGRRANYYKSSESSASVSGREAALLYSLLLCDGD